MELTCEEKRLVERMRNSPHFDLPPNLSDEEVLAQARFVDFGGAVVYNSREEAMKDRTDPFMEYLKKHDPEEYEERRSWPLYKGTIYEKTGADIDTIEEK